MSIGIAKDPQGPDTKGRLPTFAPVPHSDNRALRKRILMAGCVLLPCAILGVGLWHHYALRTQVMAAAERATPGPMMFEAGWATDESAAASDPSAFSNTTVCQIPRRFSKK